MAEKKKAAKPSAAIVAEVSGGVLAQLEADRTADTVPGEVQAGLFGGKVQDGLKKLVRKLVPAIVEGFLLTKGGTTLGPEQIRMLIEIATRVARELMARDAVSEGRPGPEAA